MLTFTLTVQASSTLVCYTVAVVLPLLLVRNVGMEATARKKTGQFAAENI